MEVLETRPSRLLTESRISFHDAAAILQTHYGTALRYAHKGARRGRDQIVRLESFRIGGRFYTTQQAVARFVDASNQTDTSTGVMS